MHKSLKKQTHPQMWHHLFNLSILCKSVSAKPPSGGLTGSMLRNTLNAYTDACGHRSAVHSNDTGWQLRKSSKRHRAGGVTVAVAAAAAALAQVRHVSRRLKGISAVIGKSARVETQCRRLRRISEVDAMHRSFRLTPTPTFPYCVWRKHSYANKGGRCRSGGVGEGN